MARPCEHEPAIPESCRICWLYLNRADYRAHWDSSPEPFTSAPRARACRHRGGELRLGLCPACRGHVQLKVLACALHQECTVGGALSGLACCATCPDYDPAETPLQRPPPETTPAAT